MRFSIITSNISADFLSPPGVPAWEDRKLAYAETLRKANPDIIGLQEVTPRQLQFLQTEFSEFTMLAVDVKDPSRELLRAWRAKYASVGFPEIPSPYEIILFYRTDTFEVLSTGYWWLSPTPDVPSIGFGNIAARVVLWASFSHLPSKKNIVVFNTHIDHRSPTSMVDLCRKRFALFAEMHASLILIGDLNFNENDPNYESLIADGWRDSHSVAHDAGSATFLYHLPNIPGGRIDHILYRGDELKPLLWQRLLPPGSSLRISDHDPVHVEFQLVREPDI